jgi:error-prone DNA polymerase
VQGAVLGLDVLGHPLAPHRQTLLEMGVSRSRELFGMPAGGRVRVAGLLECLQAPPTRSGKIVHFLLIEDESGLLQSTIFEGCYRRYGHVLYETGTYLLEGWVEQDARRGFSFVLERIFPLSRVLGEACRKYSMGEGDDRGAAGEDGFTRVVGA